jgi:hypothetical protein
VNKIEATLVGRPELTNLGTSLLAFDGWEVKELALTWEKVDSLWEIIKEYRSIFSDLTRDDKANFKRLLLSPDTFWLEAYKDGTLTALIYLLGLDHSVDATAHLVLLDRDAKTKTELIRRTAAYIFDAFPINRITVPTPVIYFATVRMLERAGFVREGVKRGAFLLGGKWHDIAIYGLLRREARK